MSKTWDAIRSIVILKSKDRPDSNSFIVNKNVITKKN